MKGILKGLRYIFQIFGSGQNNHKKGDSDMVIGEPTDVKHVAHIGNDGPSANTPSWMNEYNPATEASRNRGTNPSSGGSSETHEKPKHKSRRKASNNSDSSFSSPKVDKHTRRRSSNDSMESPSRDAPPHRKNRSANDSVDGAAQPRHSRQKKSSKGTSRTKGHSSSSADV